jgi:hypothetical protein
VTHKHIRNPQGKLAVFFPNLGNEKSRRRMVTDNIRKVFRKNHFIGVDQYLPEKNARYKK